MNILIALILANLEKVGFGIGLFLCAYLANMGLGAWKSVKIEGVNFDWKLIANSIVKFVMLGLSIALLSIVVSLIPEYAKYVGIEISADTMSTMDALVIIGAFLTATMKYVMDAVNKLKTVLQ